MNKNYEKLKNIAVVAHVDHGKTTLVDELLKQSGSFETHQDIQERVMDSGELERERGITITAKNCSFVWNKTKINLLDTPGHADFGGEVERSLLMVDSVLLLVDASEGPLPQTRFVLQKAMKQGKKIAVVINKIDRPDQRIDEVKHEIEDLFLDLATMLDISDFDLNIPFIYTSAKQGWATHDPAVTRKDMIPVLDFMCQDFFPEPNTSEGDDLQLLISNLSYSAYLGPLFVGRIQRGTLKRHGIYTCCDINQKNKNFKVSAIQIYDRLETKEVNEANAGEIVIVAGFGDAKIGDSICSTDNIDPLPRITVEPPTVSINVSVSTSPFSGRDGEFMTSRKLDDFLFESCRTNVALQYEGSDDPKVFKLKGRGELQLAIVFEQLRRKGYELMISRPEVIYKKDENGKKLEPFERLVLDVPNDVTGMITEKLAKRKGILSCMHLLGSDRTRMEFNIPSRGLIGYRSMFLTDTRGEGLMSSEFTDYRPYAGEMLARQNGSIIADRGGKITPYALFNLLNNGHLFVKPGEQCYEGMVIGEHNKQNDVNVNAIREKHLSSMRTAGKDENIILPTVQPRTLEWAMDWIDNDEWVEITPKSVRIRKKVLPSNMRSVIRRDKEKRV